MALRRLRTVQFSSNIAETDCDRLRRHSMIDGSAVVAAAARCGSAFDTDARDIQIVSLFRHY